MNHHRYMAHHIAKGLGWLKCAIAVVAPIVWFLGISAIFSQFRVIPINPVFPFILAFYFGITGGIFLYLAMCISEDGTVSVVAALIFAMVGALANLAVLALSLWSLFFDANLGSLGASIAALVLLFLYGRLAYHTVAVLVGKDVSRIQDPPDLRAQFSNWISLTTARPKATMLVVGILLLIGNIAYAAVATVWTVQTTRRIPPAPPHFDVLALPTVYSDDHYDAQNGFPAEERKKIIDECVRQVGPMQQYQVEGVNAALRKFGCNIPHASTDVEIIQHDSFGKSVVTVNFYQFLRTWVVIHKVLQIEFPFQRPIFVLSVNGVEAPKYIRWNRRFDMQPSDPRSPAVGHWTATVAEGAIRSIKTDHPSTTPEQCEFIFDRILETRFKRDLGDAEYYRQRNTIYPNLENIAFAANGDLSLSVDGQSFTVTPQGYNRADLDRIEDEKRAYAQQLAATPRYDLNVPTTSALAILLDAAAGLALSVWMLVTALRTGKAPEPAGAKLRTYKIVQIFKFAFSVAALSFFVPLFWLSHPHSDWSHAITSALVILVLLATAFLCGIIIPARIAKAL